MDFRVVWSPEAPDDLDAVAEYVARDSAFYARVVVDKILETARGLRQFPERGRVVPELADDCIREIFAYSYRIIYQATNEAIVILALVHGKRLLESIERF